MSNASFYAILLRVVKIVVPVFLSLIYTVQKNARFTWSLEDLDTYNYNKLLLESRYFIMEMFFPV